MLHVKSVAGIQNPALENSVTLALTLIYSIGQTTVVSIPPAIQPAVMARKGLRFLVSSLFLLLLFFDMTIKSCC